MRRVVLESPFAGDIEKNVAYARACVVDCLRRGETPIASHLLFTQPGILSDFMKQERAQGIEAGLVWLAVADAQVVYVDLGISEGMHAAVQRAAFLNVPTEFRYLPGYLPASASK